MPPPVFGMLKILYAQIPSIRFVRWVNKPWRLILRDSKVYIGIVKNYFKSD